ncbi:MAG TPA: hypothetical protein VGR07_21045 [Thermoanaerobaculia bacterium]|jgi:hypothetical protein|nr:hypothetical protein [Thermoanaerobaculia bacterium]
MSRRRIHVTRAAGFALALATLSLPAASAQDLTHTLTPAETACNQAQLRVLLSHFAVTGPSGESPGRPTTLLASYSNRYGFYDGLLVANPVPLIGAGSPEQILAFHLNPSVRELLLNPARPPLPQISLEREDTASSFVSATSPSALTLYLDPTADQTGGDARLQINNFISPQTGQTCNGALATATKPGRGLDTVLSLCHNKFTELDRKVFAVLERTLRAEVLGTGSPDSKIAIYRGQGAFAYRLDVYPTAAPFPGKVAFILNLQVTDSGHLVSGDLAVLPTCPAGQQLDCTNSSLGVRLWVLPPLWAGTQARQDQGAGVSLTYQPGQSLPRSVTVEWEPLLAGTTWNP